MIRRSDITTYADAATPQPGVYVTVKNVDGTLATIFDDAGNVIANSRILTGLDGAFAYNAAAGTYVEEFRLSLLEDARKAYAISLGGDVPANELLAFSVVGYGATGDGTTNDRAAIANALLAASALSSGGAVLVPKGTYNLGASGITIPAKVTLVLDGAVLKGSANPMISVALGGAGTSGGIRGNGFSSIIEYSGSGDAVLLNGTGEPQADPYIGNVWIKANGSTGNGLRLKPFNGGTLDRIKVSGFLSADGVKIEGANAITIIAPEISGNGNGLHTTTTTVGGTPYSANAITIHGGQIRDNDGWGWLEDQGTGTEVCTSNAAFGVTFESNGVNGSSTSGNVWWKKAQGPKLHGCYLEYGASDLPVSNVVIGDATNQVSNPSILGNSFLSTTATNTIYNVNGQGALIQGNRESGAVTNFHNQGAGGRGTTLSANTATAATNYAAGFDNGLDTTVVGGPGTGLNQHGSNPTGYGFNSLSGYNQDLRIRTRLGGSYLAVFQAADGSGLGVIDNSGNLAMGGHVGTNVAGKGLQVKEGSNAKMGSATLVAGTVTVNTTAVTANSRIFVDSQASAGTPGWLRVVSRVAGTSFTVNSSSGTDTSTIAWMIVEPSP